MSATFQTRSVFKYLLAGVLLSLLVLNSHALPTGASRRSLSLVDSGSDDLDVRARTGPGAVKKSPAKPAPAKVPAKASVGKKTPGSKPGAANKPPAKVPAKTTPTKVPAGKKGKVCPAKKPAAGKKTKRSLYRRAGPTTHPSALTSFTMFHGERSQEFADAKKNGIDLKKTNSAGDYHRREGACDGGFYLTDSLFAAAQFVCYQFGQTPAETAYVNEYLWTPPADLKHKAYTKSGDDVNDLANETDCKAYDLLEGPMNNGEFDKDLHDDFYQYTITKQVTVAGLQFVKQYIIPCGNVQKGGKIDASYYQEGQKSNPGFAAAAEKLVATC